MKFLAAIAVLLAVNARADSLYIDGLLTSYYYVGSGLLITGTHAAITATNMAIGDNFSGVIARGGFDSEPWDWSVDLNGLPMDGYGECTLTTAPPDATLLCD